VATQIKNRLLQEKDRLVRLRLIDALIDWDSQNALTFLQDFLFDSDHAVRKHVLEFIQGFTDLLEVPRIVKRFEEEYLNLLIPVRRDITWLCSTFLPQLCEDVFKLAINDTDLFVRINSVNGIYQSGSTDTIRLLTGCLNDSAHWIRTLAYTYLGNLVSPDYEADGIPRLDSSVGFAKSSAMGQLEKVLAEYQQTHAEDDMLEQSDAGLSKLIEQTHSDNWLNRWYAVMSLENHPHAEATSALLQRLTMDENHIVSVEAGRVLKKLPVELVRSSATLLLADTSNEKIHAKLKAILERLAPKPPSNQIGAT
jgi:HEAT repeat protein